MAQKQASVPLTQALNESVTEDEPACSQALDSNQMKTMMNMLLDMSSQLLATEEAMQQMRKKLTTGTLSPSTSRTDRSRT